MAKINIHSHGPLLLTLAMTLFLATLGLMAQENDAPADGKGSVEQAKPAIELGAPFADNAILQREMSVPVWGWSKPDTTITVEFAGQKKSSTSGKDGKWMIKLDPLKANATAQEMIISDSAGNKRVLKEILVGEVWFASGQSNMQWPASKCDVGMVLQKQIAQRVKSGAEKQPIIREAQITDYFAALHPVEHATAVWSLEATQFSGIAYAFAYDLFGALDVPIGILNCSFSQTSIQAWTPRIGFRDGVDEYTKAIYQKVMATDPNSPEHKVAWSQYYGEVENALKEGREIPVKVPGNMNDNRDASWMFNARLNPMIPYAVRGGIWNQGYANIGEGLVYYNNLHSLIRGWRLMWGNPKMPVYFNQFYCPGADPAPSIGEMAEMRLGTWLARDIPHTGMASQIDITGAIHYFNKTLSGQRLALHALKNEYGGTAMAEGPMFKAYSVSGNQVIVELENAKGGFVVAETGSEAKNLGQPKVIADGEAQVKLFYVADESRVWFPATVKIDGEKLIVASPKVPAPRGVSYGTGGIGNMPNLYNQSLLPLTPFIIYDNKMVTSKTWPGGLLKVDGVVIDPGSIGLKYEYRKMPLLSNQFRDNAVLQAGQPIVIRGSSRHDFSYEAKGKAEIKFSFAGIEKTIPVTTGMREWQVTVPAMAASAEPKTLKVSFTIEGELAHERVCTNIVIGDVWYIGALGREIATPAAKSDSLGPVRMLTRKSKEMRDSRPRRFNVSTSNALDSRFASNWESADGFALELGQRINAKTGNPVGIIVMQSAAGKGCVEPNLKSWIDAEFLDRAPSLMKDYEQLASLRPGNKYFEANGRRYVDAWRNYWGEYIPALIRTKAVADGVAWGSYPSLGGSVTTDAAQVYNVMVCPFTPGSFKGIIFLANKQMVADDEGQYFGEQMAALANCWKEKFACEDPIFIFTTPSKALAPKITLPEKINGRNTAVEISDWSDWSKVIDAAASGESNTQ